MKDKKALIALALVALIGVVGGTFAYYTSTATLKNDFKTGTYSTSVKEEFVSPDNWTPGTTTPKKVNVTNNGTVAIAARASYKETWVAADGETLLDGVRDEEKVAQFDIGENWVLGPGGYYYYNKVLGQNATSEYFIQSVTFDPDFELEEGVDIECTEDKTASGTTVTCSNLDTGYAGATYTLEITIETIQADQTTEVWEYTMPQQQ